MAGLIDRLPHLLREIGQAGTSWSIPLSMTAGAGAGTQHQAGPGATLTVPIVAKPASGRITMRGNGFAVSLASLSAGKAAGKAHVYCFLGPTANVSDYMAAPLSRRLVATTRVGLTTWRDSAGWHSAFRPAPSQLADADTVLGGGRINPISGELRDSLTAAGLDSFITLQEVRQ